ncbi:MAG: hypothetical protein JNJ88_06365 [Planctomycetes bacterium]|nr:hypothetical protein [Planctomycetota bacterium]
MLTRGAVASGVLAFLAARQNAEAPAPASRPREERAWDAVFQESGTGAAAVREVATGVEVAARDLPAARLIVEARHPSKPEADTACLLAPTGEAALRVGPEVFQQGFVRSALLGPDAALVMAIGERERGSAFRIFGMARRKGADQPLRASAVSRSASRYALSEEGDRLDAYWIPDAEIATESSPTVEGMVFGAGDRPRRFMRGHRFRPGTGKIAALRYLSPDGGSLRLSIAIPADAKEELRFPIKGASAWVTEIAPDLEHGRVTQTVGGKIWFATEASGGATLRLALSIDLKGVGTRDEQRIHLFGEFRLVPVSVENLTPWLGKHREGRPVLESFARPGTEDR